MWATTAVVVIGTALLVAAALPANGKVVATAAATVCTTGHGRPSTMLVWPEHVQTAYCPPCAAVCVHGVREALTRAVAGRHQQVLFLGEHYHDVPVLPSIPPPPAARAAGTATIELRPYDARRDAWLAIDADVLGAAAIGSGADGSSVAAAADEASAAARGLPRTTVHGVFAADEHDAVLELARASRPLPAGHAAVFGLAASAYWRPHGIFVEVQPAASVAARHVADAAAAAATRARRSTRSPVSVALGVCPYAAAHPDECNVRLNAQIAATPAPTSSGGSGLSTGAILGILFGVIGVAILGIIIIIIIVYTYRSKNSSSNSSSASASGKKAKQTPAKASAASASAGKAGAAATASAGTRAGYSATGATPSDVRYRGVTTGQPGAAGGRPVEVQQQPAVATPQRRMVFGFEDE